MNNDNQKETIDGILASIRELRASMAESDARFDRRMNKISQQMRESDAKWERRMAKSDARWEKNEAKWKENETKWEERQRKSEARWEKLREDLNKVTGTLAEQKRNVGGIGNSNGDFAEEFFHNFIAGGDRKFFGETFDRIERNRFAEFHGQYLGEYDNVLYNGKAICIVEIKYRADKKKLDFNHIIDRVSIFKQRNPQYSGFKYYLALAAFSFDKGVETKCANQGIAVFKPQGNSVVVSDKNLKVF
jgi:hypothetical protein